MTGTYLALFPALWAIAVASDSLGNTFIYSIVMLIGAVIARSAGCVINDLWDYNLDAAIKRTKNRPIASGEVTKLEAFIIFILLGIAGLVLLFFLPEKALLSGLISIPFIILYPLAKRFTHYPQVILGITFNVGAFIGWFCVSDFRYQLIVLYSAAVFWTIGYDTIYALQDAEEDKKIGVKSLAVLGGEMVPTIVLRLYGATALLLAIAGLGSGMKWPFYPVLILAAYYLYWQASTVKLHNNPDIADKFQSNVHVGFLIWIAFLLGNM